MEEVDSLKLESQIIRFHWFGDFTDMSVDNEGGIHFGNYFRKSAHLFEFLAPYVIDESYIEGQGEEIGDLWKIIFKDGKYKMYTTVWEENLQFDYYSREKFLKEQTRIKAKINEATMQLI